MSMQQGDSTLFSRLPREILDALIIRKDVRGMLFILLQVYPWSEWIIDRADNSIVRYMPIRYFSIVCTKRQKIVGSICCIICT